MAISTATLIFGSSMAAAGTAAYMFQVAIGGLIFSGVTTLVTSALMPKPKIPSVGGGNINVSIDPIGFADIIYGQVRRGGTKTYHETSHNNKYYHYFLTFAMHEVEEIGDIYINDEVATFSGDYVTESTNASGETTNWGSKILIKKFLGTSTQDIYSSLSGLTHPPQGYTTNFKGRNVACLYVRLEYNQDIFKNGAPLITAVVKGKKLYDPRKDSTSSAYDASLGVSTHRKTNAATWQYSSNPALAIRDYLTSSQGVNAQQGEIDDDMIAQAADDCASVGGASVVENSFSIDGAVNLGTQKINNLNEMIKALNGSLFWGQGKFRLVAGAYRAPAFSEGLTLDDVRGPIKIQPRFSRRDLVNTVRGTFVNRDNRWIADEFPQVQLADMSEDNNVESVLDLPLPLVTKPAAAQRLAKQVLYTGREQITFTALFSAKAYKYQVGDNVKISLDRYGWSNKEFRVLRWKRVLSAEGMMEVELTLQETSSIAYQWSISADEYREMTNNNSSLDKITDGLAINTLTITSPAPVIQADGTALGRLALTYSVPSNGNVTHFEVEWKNNGQSEYNSARATSSSFAIEPLIVGQTYDVRVRAVTSRGNTGPWKEGSKLVSGDSTAPSAPTSFSATGGFQDVKLTWVNPTASDFAYVEVWRLVSGSTYELLGRASGTQYTDGGRANSTAYTYKLRAFDHSSNASAYTATKTATTLPAVVGPNGFTTAQVFIYAAGSSAPADPTGTFTYTFATNALSGGTLGSWSTSQPTIPAGQYMWVKTASAYSNTATDTIPATEFSAAVKTVGSGTNGATGAAGYNSATVFLYKKTTSTSTPALPTTSETYTFATGSLTATDNGWTQSAPSLSAGEYLWTTTATAFANTATDTIAANEWSTPAITGIGGTNGARGAGRWTINVDTLPTSSSSANTAFVSAIGNPVNLDQAWFVRNSDFSQKVWIYNSSTSTWSEQTEVIDGNLLVTGTLTADMIQSGTLDAGKVTIKDLTINDTLQLQAGGAGFIGGRTTNSAYNEDGFFIARTDKGGGALGFEVSHTSVRNSRIEGIVHKDDGGLQIYNPQFFSGGSSTGGTTLRTTSGSINAGENSSITITVQGGGGAGGYGLNDGYASSYAASGGATTATVRAGSATGNVIATITAAGGAGGRNASDGTSGGAGQASTFGAGGGSVGPNEAAKSAPVTSYGAGGGGGGGDGASWIDASGGGGDGGSAGQSVTRTIDCSAYAGQDIWIVVSIGAGGVGSGGARPGGNGAAGAVQYSSLLGGTTQSSLSQMVNRQIGPFSTTTSSNSASALNVPAAGFYIGSASLSGTCPSAGQDGIAVITFAFQYSINGGSWQTIDSRVFAQSSFAYTVSFFLDLTSASTVNFRYTGNNTSATEFSSTRLFGPFS